MIGQYCASYAPCHKPAILKTTDANTLTTFVHKRLCVVFQKTDNYLPSKHSKLCKRHLLAYCFVIEAHWGILECNLKRMELLPCLIIQPWRQTLYT